VSVFDSRTGNVHVDETNNVAYKPFPMKLLEDLAQLCQQVKQRLTAEIEAIEQQTPATLKNPKCRPHTAAGELIANLDANTKPDAVHALATLSTEETARLETLTADLATDPDKAARALLAQKARLETGIAALAVLHGAVTQDRVDDLLQRRTEYQAAAEAAAVAAHDIFANEPLPHIGAEAWRSLWESARVYSQQQAYPAQAFPFTGDGARCVLCQQELDDAAAGRLSRFEEFVKDESKKQEQKTRAANEAALAAIRAADMSVRDARGITAAIRDELDDAALADTVRLSVLTTKWRLRRLIRGQTSLLPNAAAMPAPALRAHAMKLGARAAALKGEAESDARKAMIAAQQELADRQWLSVVQTDVLAEIERSKNQ